MLLEAVAILTLVSHILKLSAFLVKFIRDVCSDAREFKKDLQNLSRTFETIQFVLTQSDGNMWNDAALRIWFQDLKDVAYDAEDLLETAQAYFSDPKVKFSTAFEQLCGEFKIKDMLDRLNQIIERKKFIQHLTLASCDRQAPELGFEVDESAIVGRKKEKEALRSKLLGCDYDTKGGITIIPIVGMSGLGKTTLAQLLYHDDRVKTHFGRFRMWVCVTVNFDLTRVLRHMVQCCCEMSSISSLLPHQLHSHFRQLIAGKSFLLVLDDIWTSNYKEWEPLLNLLKQGGKGSRVLVTTQKPDLCRILGKQYACFLGNLLEAEAHTLFERIAFAQGNPNLELKKVGREIVRMCDGWPLAVKEMGYLLRGNADVNEWKKILSNNILETDARRCKYHKPNILSALKLSYDCLPPYLKPCFEYCSIFPRGYLLDEETLVQLWMAEDLIQSQPGQETAAQVAREHFNELLTYNCFLQNPNDYNHEKKYRMRSLFHELAQFISAPFCSQVKDSRQYIISENTRYVSLTCKDVKRPVLELIDKSKKLRTLLSPSAHLKFFGNTLDEMFRRLTYIRVLDLSSSEISELPKSIEKLKLLRYLDLSKTEIRMFPNSICKLKNLQTLKFSGCCKLSELPKQMFQTLRYIRVLDLSSTPISKLPEISMENLELLHYLDLSKTEIRMLPDSICKVKSLQTLKLLGCHKLSHLPKDLDKLTNLRHLEQDEKFGAKSAMLPSENVDLQDTTEEMGQELQLCHYRGKRFQQDAETLSFKHCTKCRTLSLPQLPQLKVIDSDDMPKLEEWSEEQRPFLQTLKISNCPKLLKLPNLFQHLKRLTIIECNSVKALPAAPFLEFLTVEKNPLLEDWNTESRSNFTIDKTIVPLPSSLSKLLELQIEFCPKLQALPQTTILQKLEISRCESLLAVLPGINSLQFLAISNIPNVKCFPKWPNLPGVKELHIKHCKDLESFSEETSPLQGFTSLKLFYILNCPKLANFPGVGLPTRLENLIIASCQNLESLGPGDVLKCLTSLEYLNVQDCPKLQSLPEDGFFTSLKCLVIQRCPLLQKRCQRGGPDWPKIKNIRGRDISFKPNTKPSSLPWHHCFPFGKGGTSKGKELAESLCSSETGGSFVHNEATESSPGEQATETTEPSISVENGGKSVATEAKEPSSSLGDGANSIVKETTEPSSSVENGGKTVANEANEPSSSVGDGGNSIAMETTEPLSLLENGEKSVATEANEASSSLGDGGNSTANETIESSSLVENGGNSIATEAKEPSSSVGDGGNSIANELKEPSNSVENGGNSIATEASEPSSSIGDGGNSISDEPKEPSNSVENGENSTKIEPKEPLSSMEHDECLGLK